MSSIDGGREILICNYGFAHSVPWRCGSWKGPDAGDVVEIVQHSVEEVAIRTRSDRFEEISSHQLRPSRDALVSKPQTGQMTANRNDVLALI